MRSVFSQVIIAMAHHQYLAHEGGQMLIEFIVRQCGINTALVPKVNRYPICACILIYLNHWFIGRQKIMECTIVWKFFVVKKFSWVVKSMKIYHTKIDFTQIIKTLVTYSSLTRQCLDWSILKGRMNCWILKFAIYCCYTIKTYCCYAVPKPHCMQELFLNSSLIGTLQWITVISIVILI